MKYLSCLPADIIEKIIAYLIREEKVSFVPALKKKKIIIILHKLLSYF
jgi:hypothetical protein